MARAPLLACSLLVVIAIGACKRDEEVPLPGAAAGSTPGPHKGAVPGDPQAPGGPASEGRVDRTGATGDLAGSPPSTAVADPDREPATGAATVPRAPQKPSPDAAKLAPLGPDVKAVSTHAPYEIGDCTFCHERNAVGVSPGPIMLPTAELCFSCHGAMRTLMAKKVVHLPADESCTNCHNPHDAPAQKLLRDEMTSLCASCHEEVGRQVAGATVRHGAVVTAGRCLNCHSPHASDEASLLVRPPVALCVTCHSRDNITDEKGRRLTNMKQLLESRRVQHQPVKEGTCSGCHDPHGGRTPRLLKARYTGEFYAAWDPANYALCFKCHDRKVFEAQETRTLTGFRDGAKNLHYVHVRQERGRTCRACHEVHASTQAHLVRTSVPYGSRGWTLKLSYTETRNGGTCAKTCHKERGYDRTR